MFVKVLVRVGRVSPEADAFCGLHVFPRSLLWQGAPVQLLAVPCPADHTAALHMPFLHAWTKLLRATWLCWGAGESRQKGSKWSSPCQQHVLKSAWHAGHLYSFIWLFRSDNSSTDSAHCLDKFW